MVQRLTHMVCKRPCSKGNAKIHTGVWSSTIASREPESHNIIHMDSSFIGNKIEVWLPL